MFIYVAIYALRVGLIRSRTRRFIIQDLLFRFLVRPRRIMNELIAVESDHTGPWLSYDSERERRGTNNG